MSTTTSSLLESDLAPHAPPRIAVDAADPTLSGAEPHPALHLRRLAVLRRHAARSVERASVLVLADLIAFAAIAALLAVLAGNPAAPGWLTLLAATATPKLPFVLGVSVAALAIGGAYHRRASGYTGVALLRGALLAAILLGWYPAAVLGIPAILLPAAILFAAALASLLAMRAGAGWILREVWPGRLRAPAALFVGSRAEYRVVAEELDAGGSGDYRFVGWVSPGNPRTAGALGGMPALPTLIHEHGVETVVVGAVLREERLRQLRDVCLATGCELLYPVGALRLAGIRPRLVWRDDQPYFELGAPALRARAIVVKRVVDVLGAAAGLILLAPVLLAVALTIRIDSPGPVLFVQHRAGLGGRRFRMLKFRTMRCGADAEKEVLAHLNLTGDPRLFKIADDPRVTRFGRFLRRWSLDELPQLWNVLMGDMSLVGPRPFFERDLAAYEDHHFHRLGAKPGITGLWQVSGRSSIVDFEEVVRLDRQYIEGWTLWLDTWILLRTVPAVLSRTGAY